jgi:hypothetical protein
MGFGGLNAAEMMLEFTQIKAVFPSSTENIPAGPKAVLSHLEIGPEESKPTDVLT